MAMPLMDVVGVGVVDGVGDGDVGNRTIRRHWTCGTGDLDWSSGRMIDFVRDSDHTIPDGDFIMLEGLSELLRVLPDIHKLEELKELAETESFQQD